jgi:hypothetical protein
MWKKSVCGLTLLVAGLLVWSCGDGSVDSLTDNELLMISRFPSTIDYDMLDSIVEACKKDEACWEKAKKTGEIYKGDYTKVLRDSSGNIVIVEGDSAFIYDKSGKKLPVFNFSSNSNDDDDDDVTSSGSTATSGSSSKSSGSGFEDGGGYTDDGTGQGASGGSGTSAIVIDRSSSSKKTESSSSVDLSFLSSSSKKKIDLDTTSTKVSSSSENTGTLSAGSSGSWTSGGSGGGKILKCGEKPVVGECKPAEDHYFVGETVTYTYTPSSGSCTEDANAYWDVQYSDATPSNHEGGFSLDVVYSTIGVKSAVTMTVDETPILCGEVKIEAHGLEGCVCTLSGSSSVDLASGSPSDSVFAWVITGCETSAPNKTMAYTWSVNGSSGTGSSVVPASFSVKLNKAGSYTPVLTVANVDGTEMKPVCTTINISNSDPAIPVEIKEKEKGYSVANGQKVKISVDNVSNMHCYGKKWQNSACTITVTGADGTDPVVGSVPNCNGSYWNSHITFPLSRLDENNMATVSIENMDSGGLVECEVR